MPRIISLWQYTIDSILQSNSSNSQSKFSFPLGLCSCSKGISPQVPAVPSDFDHHDHHDYYDSGNDVPLKFSYIQHGIMYPTLSWDLLPKCMKELSPTWASWVDTGIFFIVISDLIWALWWSLHRLICIDGPFLYTFSTMIHYPKSKQNSMILIYSWLNWSHQLAPLASTTKQNTIMQGPGLIPGA